MSVHLDRDLENLKKLILSMGSLVEEQINRSISSLQNRRPELADEVVEGDDEVDHRELEIEEECIKILALHQPVASDLRFIIAVLKVKDELERMGDQAANIAIRARFLANHDPIDVTMDLTRMLELVQTMVDRSIDALINRDPELAWTIFDLDEEVNDCYNEVFVEVQELMAEQPDTIERALHSMMISRYLERIGDLTKNISEAVIFLVEGEMVRREYADSGEVRRVDPTLEDPETR